ncbi:MAG: metal ABC transporter solute-binding protein, Zn/Mn family [Acidimicrobiales bacterium]
MPYLELQVEKYPAVARLTSLRGHVPGVSAGVLSGVPAGVLASLLAALLAVGCSAQVPAPLAHPLRVSAQPFALAEAARRVGLGRVQVVDDGGVVLTSGTNADPWLDPQAMESVTTHVADQLAAADPAGAAAYRDAAAVFRAQLGSLEVDYQTSLADCARHDVVTTDHGFDGEGARFGFHDHAVEDPGVAALIEADHLPVVFGEMLPPPPAVTALAAATHTKVGYLSTLTALTPGEQARNATYVSVMTDNLAALSSALDCAAPT